MVLWKDIRKTKAYSTVEEFTRLESYGQDNDNAFWSEGQLPREQDSTYSRQARFVKYLGVTKSVLHPLTLARTQGGDVRNLENMNGLRWLLQALERSLFFGNSQLNVGATEWIEFDGLQQLIPAANIIDLQGQPLDERTVRNGAQTILDNYGVPTHMYGSPNVIDDFAKQYIPNNRILIPTAGEVRVGMTADSVNTIGGPVALRSDVFLRLPEQPPAAATHAEAPTAPTAAAALSGAPDSGEWSKSTAGGLAVTYRVTSVNAQGQSAPATSGTVTVLAADLTESIALTITNVAGVAPVYFKVFRRDTATGTYRLISRIAASSAAAGATTVFTDRNVIMTGVYEAYMGQLDTTVIEFRQLTDVVKMDLATISPAIRWMILMYGVPVLYVPGRWVRFINIGAAS